MRSRSTRVAMFFLCLTSCSPGQEDRRDSRRITLLATGVDTADFIVSDIVRRQRDLFEALSSGHEIKTMTDRMFTIRDLNAKPPTLQDSSVATILKLAALPVPTLYGDSWRADQMYLNPTDEMIDRFRGYAKNHR